MSEILLKVALSPNTKIITDTWKFMRSCLFEAFIFKIRIVGTDLKFILNLNSPSPKPIPHSLCSLLTFKDVTIERNAVAQWKSA